MGNLNWKFFQKKILRLFACLCTILDRLAWILRLYANPAEGKRPRVDFRASLTETIAMRQNLIELHHHLDGAFRCASLYEEAKRRRLPQGNLDREIFCEKTTVSPSCSTLSEFLQTFYFFYEIAQSPQFMERAAFEAAEDMHNAGVIYAETRFAPHLLSTQEYSPEDIVQSVLRGLGRANKELGITVRVILTMMRGRAIQELHEIIDLYNTYKGIGLAGIDLAGDETLHSGREYAPLFNEASEAGIPVTIHAGEGTSAQRVREAILLFGANRIGHGIKAAEDESVMDLLIERNIPLETCLTSNLHTGTVQNISKHPVGIFLKRGVPVTINTDDPAISGITLASEWDLFRATFSPDTNTVQKILFTSAQASFAPDRTKEALYKIFPE